ncbi:hypothetical protein [Candidatus Nitrospira allomarina]|uniref:Uncharacterized protein n=1 Tax=Candidatus Nitrospira allomarina TaxID=3020900 RepID=A0AA96GEV0_9BACT|nr:hypothetical protein [Candidatus Nitrospira allomarina]WNM58930.1 hypothetical protein PP769_03955 [Candidatus Nitrospira allomarina]
MSALISLSEPPQVILKFVRAVDSDHSAKINSLGDWFINTGADPADLFLAMSCECFLENPKVAGRSLGRPL